MFFKKTRNMRIIPAAVMGISGFSVILVSTYSFGPGISHDSAAYIYAAGSLLAGRGYEYFGYVSPFIQWPPLFPTLLALPGIAGVDPATASRYINAVVFGLIVFLSGVWLNRHLRNRWTVIPGTAAVLFGAPLIYASSYVWTEPLFTLLFLVFMFEFEKYVKQQNHSYLVKASVAAALACLDRYMGITVIFTGCLLLLAQKKNPAKRLADIFMFGFVASFPTAVWVIRNYTVSSTFAGLRTPAKVSLYENIKRAVETVISWLLPYKNLNNPFTLLQAVSIGLTALAVLVLVIMIFSKRGDKRKEDMNKWLESNGFAALLLIIFIFIYAACMIASATSVAFDAIGDRYMLPVYVPVFFVILLLMDCIIYSAPEHISCKVAVYVLLASLCLWLVYPVAGTCDAVGIRIRKGIPGSYYSAEWRSSKLISYLQEIKPEYIVCSNYPDAIYVLTEIEAKYTPKKKGLPEFYGMGKFEQRVKKDGGAYLAWFDRGEFNAVYNAKELKEYFDVGLIKKLEDGTLYFIKPHY